MYRLVLILENKDRIYLYFTDRVAANAMMEQIGQIIDHVNDPSPVDDHSGRTLAMRFGKIIGMIAEPCVLSGMDGQPIAVYDYVAPQEKHDADTGSESSQPSSGVGEAAGDTARPNVVSAGSEGGDTRRSVPAAERPDDLHGVQEAGEVAHPVASAQAEDAE